MTENQPKPHEVDPRGTEAHDTEVNGTETNDAAVKPGPLAAKRSRKRLSVSLGTLLVLVVIVALGAFFGG